MRQFSYISSANGNISPKTNKPVQQLLIVWERANDGVCYAGYQKIVGIPD